MSENGQYCIFYEMQSCIIWYGTKRLKRSIIKIWGFSGILKAVTFKGFKLFYMFSFSAFGFSGFSHFTKFKVGIVLVFYAPFVVKNFEFNLRCSSDLGTNNLRYRLLFLDNVSKPV